MSELEIVDNVIKEGRQAVVDNMHEILDGFIETYADDLWDVTQEMLRLKAENAELRERLEKAVELPCKVGDILYTVTFSLCDGYDDCGNRLYNSGWNIFKEKVTEKNFYRMCDFVRNGKAFFSEEGAKVRLKELQGGGK